MTFVQARRTPLSVSVAMLSVLLVSALFLAAILLGTFAASPWAAAHDPIFIGDDQKTPDIGPYMPDGTTSWALYGQVVEAGDTRGFEFDLRDGDELYISILIPNLAPEVDLSDAELPVIELESPSGEVRTIAPEIREVFDEPFSRTSYVTLSELREPAEAGRYRGVVVGGAPARFSVAIGENEIFFTETERSGDRPSSFQEITAPLQAWYTTLPGEEAPTDVELAEGEAEIDLDMIEEAMESGEGRIEGEGTIRTDDAAEAEEPVAEEAPAEEAVETAEEPVADEAETTTETASEATDEDSGSSAALVAPLVVLGAVVVGGGFFMARRGRSNNS